MYFCLFYRFGGCQNNIDQGCRTKSPRGIKEGCLIHVSAFLAPSLDSPSLAPTRATFDPRFRYQDLDTKILVSKSWYQDLGSKIQVPRSWYQDVGTKILVPRSWHPDFRTMIMVPESWYQNLRTNIFGTKIPVPRSWYQHLGTKILVRSWYQGFGNILSACLH